MSEHQAYVRSFAVALLGAMATAGAVAGDTVSAKLPVRGRFREAADGNDYALPLYREYPSQAYYTPNAFDRKTGKAIPRHNERKAAVRRASKGIAL